MSTHGIKPFEDVASLRHEVRQLMTEVRLTDLLPYELSSIVDVLGEALIRRSKPVFGIKMREDLDGLSDTQGTIAP